MKFQWFALFMLTLACRGFCQEIENAEVCRVTAVDQVAGKIKGVKESRISLELKNAPLDKVVQNLNRVSKTNLELSLKQDAPIPRLNLSLSNVAFLDALGEICRSAKMTLHRTAPEDKQAYRLIPGDDLWKLPSCNQGYARVFAIKASRFHNEVFTNRVAPTQATRISMILLAERQTPIIRYSAFAQIDEALDDHGESLIPSSPRQPDVNEYKGSLMPFSVVITSAPEGAILKSLKGRVWLALEEETEDWVIDDPFHAKAQSKRVAGIETLNFEVPQPGKRFTLSAKLEDNSSDARSTLLSSSFLKSHIEMFDVQDRPIPAEKIISGGSSSTKTIDNAEILKSFAIQFSPLPSSPAPSSPDDPRITLSKLKIRVPKTIKAVEIPFEFNNLQLP